MADKNFKVKSGLNIPITSAAILTTDSSGNISSTSALAIANGGTGQTTATNAINALLPIQNGSTVNYSIQSDGTNISWAKVYNQLIQNAGTSVTPRRNINIVGGTFADDAGTDTTTITFTDNVGVSKSGGDTITASSASVIPLIAKGAASQSASLQEWHNSSGQTRMSVNSFGSLLSNAAAIFNNSLNGTGTSLIATTTDPGGKPLVVKGAASQTANLFEWQNSGGTVLGFINSAGFLKSNYVYVNGLVDTADNGAYLSLNSNGNNGSSVIATNRSAGQTPFAVKGFASQTADYFQIQNSSGTILAQLNASNQFNVNYGSVYSQGGFRGGVNNHIGYAGLSGFAYSPAYLAIGAQGAVNQTANLQEWRNSSGTVLSAVSPLGQNVIGSSTPLTNSAVQQSITAVTFTSTTATYTYTSTLQVMTVGDYVTISGLDPSGYNGSFQVTAIATVSAGSSYSFTVANTTNTTVVDGTGLVALSAGLSVTIPDKAHTGIIIKAAANQSAAMMEFRTSAGALSTWWDASGAMTASTAVVSTLYSGGFMNTGTLGYYNATTFNAAVSPIVVRGAASQTADLQQWQNSAGTVLASVAPSGYLTLPGIISGAAGINSSASVGINIPNFTSSAQLAVSTAGASYLGIVVRGVASQTANLQEWQNSAGTVLASINASGNLMVQDLTVNGTTTTINSTTLTVDDKNIELASVASPTDTTADGAGITIKGATDKTFNWVQSTAAFTSSEPISAPAFKSAGTSVSSNITLVSGYKYFVDTTAARTLTLPASPSLGDEIYVFDASNTALTNNITVASNSNKIQGSVQDLIIDSNAATVYLTYTGSTYGWAVS